MILNAGGYESTSAITIEEREADMEHEMLLLDADFKTVLARMTARRKQHATVAQAEEQPIRTRQVGVSITSGSSTFEERE